MQIPATPSNKFRRFFVSAILTLIVGALAVPMLRAQSSQLNLADIMTALRSKKATAAEKNKLLTDGVWQRGVTFSLSPELEKELRAVGASDELVNAIRAKSPAPVEVKPTPAATPAPTPIPVPVKKEPDFTFFQNKANQNVVLGDFAAAIVDYGRAIELAPNEASLYLGRALALTNTGETALAVNDLNKLLELNPDDASVLAKRGAAFEKLNNEESAVRDYRRALEIDPANAASKAAIERIEASARVTDSPKQRVIVVQNKPVEPPMKSAPTTTTTNPAPVSLASIGALNEYAEKLAMPFYPTSERQRRTEGVVTVEVLLNEEGKVETAKAVSGPMMLRKYAEDAVRKSKFKAVTVDGNPVRATGFINFNFKVK